MSGAVRDLLVVVPARDEEVRLPDCLDALERAAAAVADRARVLVVVVLDRCRDRSAEVVARRPRVLAVPSLAGSAGGARAIGVGAGLSALATASDGPPGVRPPAGTWIASTDADSVVPVEWLVHQLDAAAAGADLLLGTVRPRADELPPGLVAAWEGGYAAVDGHPHVHAANLGVRAAVYLAVGGFPAVPTHEDVLLADAVRAAGGRVLATATAPVLTSGRLVGRAPAGFADHLAGLCRGAGPSVPVARAAQTAVTAPADAAER